MATQGGILARWSMADHHNPYEATPWGFDAVSGASIALSCTETAARPVTDQYLNVTTAQSAAAVAYAKLDLDVAAPNNEPWLISMRGYVHGGGTSNEGGLKATAGKPGDAYVALQILDEDGVVLASLAFKGESYSGGIGTLGRVQLTNSNGDTKTFDGGVVSGASYVWHASKWLIYVDPVRNRLFATASHGKFTTSGTPWYTANSNFRQFAPIGWNWDDGAGAYNPPDDTIYLTWKKAGDKVPASIRIYAIAATDADAGKFACGYAVQGLAACKAKWSAAYLGDSLADKIHEAWNYIPQPTGRAIVPVTWSGAKSNSVTIGHTVDFWRRHFGAVVYALGTNDIGGVAAFQADLDAKCLAAETAGHKLILSGALGVPNVSATWADIPAINAAIKTVADTYALPLVQIHDLLMRTELGSMARRVPLFATGDETKTRESLTTWGVGNEANDAGASEFDSVNTAGGGAFVSGSMIHHGLYGLSWSGGDAGQGYGEKAIAASAAFEVAIMFYMRYTALADGKTTDILRLYYDDGGWQDMAALRVTRSGTTITIIDGSDNSIGTIIPGHWVRLSIGRAADNYLYYHVGVGGYLRKSAGTEVHALAGLRVGKYTTAANSAIATSFQCDQVAFRPFYKNGGATDWWNDVHICGEAAMCCLGMYNAAIAGALIPTRSVVVGNHGLAWKRA